MRSRRAALTIASLLTLASMPLAAQQPDQSHPIETLHASTRIVALDVVVNDGKGNPVRGLKQSDFTLLEDGVPQTLLSFTEHDATLGAHASAEPAQPPNTFSVMPTYTGDGSATVVVFGLMLPTDEPWVRKQLHNYLIQTQPGTPMAVIRQDRQGTHLVQELTSDRTTLLSTVDHRLVPGEELVRSQGVRSNFNLARYLSSLPGHINLIWFGSGIGRHPYPDITRFVEDPDGLTAVLQLSRIALYPMDAAAFVGFYNTGTGAPVPGLQGGSIGAIGGTGGILGFGSRSSFGPGSPLGVFGIGNTAGGSTAAFPYDTGGPFGSGGQIFPNPSLGAIGEIATETGGRAFRRTNGYVSAIAEVVNTGAHYYTVSYTPRNTIWDGAYRAIELEVPGYSTPSIGALASAFGAIDKNEFKLEYRRGYVATHLPTTPTLAETAFQPPPDHRILAMAPPVVPVKPVSSPMALAMAFGMPTPTAIRFTVSVTPLPEIVRAKADAALATDNRLTPPFRAMNYRNYQLHYRLAPADLKLFKDAGGADVDNLEFVTFVYRDDGVEANSLVSAGHIAFAAANYGPIMASPFGFDQVIAVPDGGTFYLRAGVHEMASDRIGAIEFPVADISLQLPDPQPLTASTH